MQFSIWESSGHSWADLAAVARFADAGGWHGLWVPDHYMPNTDDDTVSGAPVHEAWALLPALAALTERVRLGPLVSPTSIHHPSLLANRAATIDHISGGRFVLGIGAGWQVNEHRAYGFELDSPGRRVARFEEAIQIVRSLLDGPRTDFAGSHFVLTDAPCEPKPIQPRLPILVGTKSPRMLAITARYADEWNCWGAPDTIRGAMRALDEACERVGRDPATIRRTAQPLLFLGATETEAATRRAQLPAERAVAATAPQLAEIMGEYAAIGVDELIVPAFGLSPDRVVRIEQYAEIWEVAARPHLG